MPKLWDAKKATIVGTELVLKKELITQLHRKLAHRLNTD